MLTNILIESKLTASFKTPVMPELSTGGHITMAQYSLETDSEGIFT